MCGGRRSPSGWCRASRRRPTGGGSRPPSYPCEASPAAARAVAEQLLREQPALTGVVVHNEAILEPLIDAFEELGLRVPADLSITAICPDELAASLRVPVTSIALPAAEVGARAVELLMKKLDGKAVPEATLLPPGMTERGSTARRTVA